MSNPTTDSDPGRAAASISRILQGDHPQALMDEALRRAAALFCSRPLPGPGGAPLPCLACLACRKVLSRSHVDVSILDGGPDGAVKVDDIRALRADLIVRPFDGEHKVYILAHAHTLNAAAQNALLTVLEEPPRYARFLLLTDNAGALLPTVRSRCALTLLPPAAEPPPDPQDEERARAYLSAALSKDGWAAAGAAMAMEKLTRDELSRVLRAALRLLSPHLRDPVRAPASLAMCDRLTGLIDALERNASAGTVCGALMAYGACEDIREKDPVTGIKVMF